MEKIIFVEYVIAIAIRYWLFESDYNDSLANRIEVSTPLNAWKRVIEGVVLYRDGTNPYIGDMFHESPLVLLFFTWVTDNFTSKWINAFFICCDLLTSFILYKASRVYLVELFQRQEQDKESYADDVEEALLKKEDSLVTSSYTVSAYLFNPYCILNCIAKTTTVLSNLFLSLVFYSMLKGYTLLCCIALAFCTLQSLYPVILIVPVCLYKYKTSKNGNILTAILPIVYFIISLSVLLYACYIIVGDWSFVDSTFNFILNVPDLKPNIGLFWYFFTEMFEHFRPLFLVSFQVNATILYLSALSIRLRNEPVLLAATLTALIAIFKSYPSIGDVGFYIALLPMWKHLFQFMQQGFIVTCFFVGCTMFAPTVWHLWIYSGSANANFYFGVTLAFATTQPMLSQIRRQDDPDGYYRLRSFSITPNGVCKNLGDCLKTRRSRSSCSVDSSPAPSSHRLTVTNSQESNNEVPVFTVGMLGASNVGKTTLSYQFTTSEYICAYDTSLDDEFGQKTVCISLNGQEAEFNIIDIPASEMSVETFCYTFNVDVFVVVYSIVDMQSFKTAEDILLYLWKNDYMSSKGVILVGNKADLERRREIPVSTGRKLALSLRCKFIETSSGLDHNVDELLVGIFAQVQLNPKRNRMQQRGAVENGKQLFKQILKFGKKAKSCENLFVL